MIDWDTLLGSLCCAETVKFGLGVYGPVEDWEMKTFRSDLQCKAMLMIDLIVS